MLLLARTLLCLAIAASLAGPAAAASRVALVIGNSGYRHATPLKNPGNDAADVAAALERLGFEVVLGRDLDRSGMERVIRDFARTLTGSTVALFYYAGHGLQVQGKNYLAPVDARLSSQEDLDFETLPLHLVLRQMEREKRTNLVFLDACRDNPLAKNLARSLGTRSAAVGRGLARIETGIGTLIAYATQPGNVALDGQGRNSPFTTAMLRHIETPGKAISEIMIAVRNDVLKASSGKQVPWEHSSLTGQFYFKREAVRATGAASSIPTTPKTRRDDGKSLELAYWDSIRDGNKVEAFESYLKSFPSGTFAPLARLKIKEIQDRKQAALPSPPPAPAAPTTAKPPTDSLHRCDRMAAVPFDPRARGRSLRTLRKILNQKVKEPADISVAAVAACRQAVKEQPQTARFQYQLAVALWQQQGAGAGAGNEVFGLLSQAAQQGYPAAMLTLADAFRKRGGENRRARQWLRKAVAAYRTEAAAGNAEAMTGLALIFGGEYANLGVKRQPVKATAWLRRAVEHQSPLGTFVLLGAFADQFKILKAPKLTFLWLRNMAAKGNPQAMFATGLLYLSSKVVKQDVVQALSWFTRAAAKGSHGARLVLAAVQDQYGNTQSGGSSADAVLQAFRAQTPFVLLLTEDDKLKLSSATWAEVQRRLAAAGHYSGTADGLLGVGTKRALFAYATTP